MNESSTVNTLETPADGNESISLADLRQKTYLDLIQQVDRSPCLLTVREGEVIYLTLPILSVPTDPLLSADLTSLSGRILRDLVMDGYITQFWRLENLTTPELTYVYIAVRPGFTGPPSCQAAL